MLLILAGVNCSLWLFVICFLFVLQKMVNGGTVNNWICINFARNVQENIAAGFCHELALMCRTSGMVCLQCSHVGFGCT